MMWHVGIGGDKTCVLHHVLTEFNFKLGHHYETRAYLKFKDTWYKIGVQF